MTQPNAAPIYLWHYFDDKNYPGWHMTADAAGCAAFVRALDELVLLPEERSQIFRVLAPTPRVLRVPNARSTQVHVAKRLRITIDRRQPHRFAMTEDERGVELALGIDRVGELRDHVEGIPRGEGDLCMSPEGKRSEPPHLWFWWM